MGEHDGGTDPASEPVSARRHRRRSPRRGRRIVVWALTGALLIGAFGAGWLTHRLRQGNEPFEVKVATLLRDYHMGWAVAQLENIYFTFIDTAPIGGTPTISADIGEEDAVGFEEVIESPSPEPVETSLTDDVAVEQVPEPTLPRLQPPERIISPVLDPEPKEGEWQPVGTKIDGEKAIYVTRVRADDIHTSVYASLMWIDTSRTKALFVPGFEEPAGGPNPFNGQLPDSLQAEVLASTNGGFRLGDSMGGYYYDGIMVKPLVKGKASAVFFADGTVRIGKWGRDFEMSDDIVAVRQNLDLIVDKGVSEVSNADDNIVWGATTDKESMTWRAAIGERADGSLVYVVGPYMSAQGLGDTLVRAGVERAMVVDMNKYWAAGFYYRHNKAGQPQCRKLHPEIPDLCDRFLKPFKRDVFHFLADPHSA